MHVDSDVVVATESAHPGMDPDPHAHRHVLRPRHRCQAPLNLDGGRHRRWGLGEHHQERVALRAALRATVLAERSAQHVVVAVEDVGEGGGPDLLHEVRRSLDIGHQEGDGPGRQGALDHARSIRPRVPWTATTFGR
jgi:hypothetical protein